MNIDDQFQSPQYAAPQGPAPSATWPLVQGILVTLLCCLPLGVVGIIYAAMAMSKISSGDYAGAASNIKTSNTWSWIGAGIGLLVVVGYIILMVLGIAAGAAGSGP